MRASILRGAFRSRSASLSTCNFDGEIDLVRGLGIRRHSAKYALLQVLLEQHQPGGTATGFVGLGYPGALSDQGHCADDRTWKSR